MRIFKQSGIVAVLLLLLTAREANASWLAKITKYQVKPALKSQFESAAAAYVKQAQNAAGNIMAEAYYEKERVNEIWIIERWTDSNSWSSYQKTTAAKALTEQAAQVTAAAPEITDVNDLEPITKAAWRKEPAPGDHPFTIVLIVKTKVGTQHDFKTRYHAAMPKFRGEPGVITYQLSQPVNDDRTFLTYEKFRNDEAFQYHLKFPPVNPIIDFLRTSIEDPPFEKGIHNLIQFAPQTTNKQ